MLSLSDRLNVSINPSKVTNKQENQLDLYMKFHGKPSGDVLLTKEVEDMINGFNELDREIRSPLIKRIKQDNKFNEFKEINKPWLSLEERRKAYYLREYLNEIKKELFPEIFVVA